MDSTKFSNKSTITILLIQIFLPIIVVVVIPLSIYFVNIMTLTDQDMYESTWHIDLPDHMKKIYRKVSPADFHGSGAKYSIYQLTSVDADYFKKFHQTENTEVENNVQSVLQELAIADDKRPSMSQKYIWRSYTKDQNDTLVILYFPDSKTLYLIQYIF